MRNISQQMLQSIQTIPQLCRSDERLTERWMNQSPIVMLGVTLPVIILGCGSFGLGMGIWHGVEMASYAGIKFPLVVIATLCLNALLNGMLAMVLGSGITLRQSMQFLFTAFAICALILGALSPITIAMALQGPEAEASNATQFHSIVLITNVLLISYAGIVSHSLLLGALRKYSSSLATAHKTFAAWLAGNLFVGAQVGWISRPFFCSPGNPVEFLREDKFASSFYEAFYNAFSNFF